MFENKNILLLSTSPGKRGGVNSLEIAKFQFPIHGATIVTTFSLPLFDSNFNQHKGITNPHLEQQFQEAITLTKEKF